MISNVSYFSTNAALTDADGLAKQILYGDSLAAAGTTATVHHHHHDHYNWGSGWGWGGGWGYAPRPVYVNYGPSESSRSEKQDHSWIAIPAGIAVLAIMYFAGKNHAEWSQASEGIRKLQQRNIEVREELSHAHPALKKSVKDVFNRQMDILQHAKSDATTGLVLKGLLATSLVVTGAGALASGGYLAASLTPLLAYGGVSAFLTSAAMLYRAGFSSKDLTMQENARQLALAVQQAKAVAKEVG